MRVVGLQTHTANGANDMGDVADATSICRFRAESGLWLPMRVLAKFTAGTGSATLSMRLDGNPTDTLHDYLLAEWLEAGTDGKADIFWRPPEDERENWIIQPPFGVSDPNRWPQIVFEWTNPDAGVMTWELMVTLGAVTLG